VDIVEVATLDNKFETFGNPTMREREDLLGDYGIFARSFTDETRKRVLKLNDYADMSPTVDKTERVACYVVIEVRIFWARYILKVWPSTSD
jgi:hypothetical protein